MEKIQRFKTFIRLSEDLARLFSYTSLPEQEIQQGLKKIATLLHCREVRVVKVEKEKKFLATRSLYRHCLKDEAESVLNLHRPFHLRLSKTERARYPEELQSLLIAPIFVENELYAFIEAINAKNKFFTREDEYFLQAMIFQLSILLKYLRTAQQKSQQLMEICEALAEAISKKDKYTGGHTKRVGHFARMIAEEMKLTENQREELTLAGTLHDIGKIGIADEILKKKSALNQQEFETMKDHPRFGHEILKHIHGMDGVIDGMRYHHERPDGKGYPYGLKGSKIPLVARIISVADTFDAMISNRPYRQGLPTQEALKEIARYAGTQFDRQVVKALERAIGKTKMLKRKKL